MFERRRSPLNKIALILHWGYFRASGRFFNPEQFRKDDIKWIAKHYQLTAKNLDWIDYQSSHKLVSRHRNKVRELLGISSFSRQSRDIFDEHVARLVAKNYKPRDIVFAVASTLHQQQIEIPAYHTFAKAITKAYQDHEDRLARAVQDNITREQSLLLDALVEDFNIHQNPASVFRWKHINQSIRQKDIRKQVQDFIALKKTYFCLEPLLHALDLTVDATEYYADWTRKAKLSQLRQFPDKTTRHIYVLAFIRHQFYLRSDTLVDILKKVVQRSKNEINKKLREREKERRNKLQEDIDKLLADHDDLNAVIDDIEQIMKSLILSNKDKVANTTQRIIEHRKQQAQNASLATGLKQSLSNVSDDEEYYELLELKSRSLMGSLKDILMVLAFNPEDSDADMLTAIECFVGNHGDIPTNASTAFLETKDADAVRLNRAKISRPNLYKSLLFLRAVDHIKAGTLNLRYSYRYKPIQDYIINKQRWEAERDTLLKAAGLFAFGDFDTVINDLKKSLDDKYKQVNWRIDNNQNQYYSISQAGNMSLTTPAVDKGDNESVAQLMPEPGVVSIIHILKDVDNFSKFGKAIRHSSSKNAKLKVDIDTIIAGLMAKGHNIGINRIGNISIGINKNTLRQAVTWMLTPQSLEDANNLLLAKIDAMKLSNVYAIANHNHTASDGTKVDIAVDSLLANHSFKYFGNSAGVSVYSFIDQKQSLFYSTVISPSDREAAYVMDGLMNNKVVKSTQHSTDSHGYMESCFAATHFIGVSFAPRIAKLYKQKIYGFGGVKKYEKKGYAVKPSRSINLRLLRSQWEDILRFMCTIKLRECSASQLFTRLSSYARENPLYKALKEFGRIIKSQFILSYIDDVELRQSVEKQLNRVEHANRFSKAVFWSRNQKIHDGLPEEQKVTIGCKTVIQNALVLWNYMYLSQLILDHTDPEAKAMIIETVRNGSVQCWSHANMQGEFDFTKEAANMNNFDIKAIMNLDIAAA